MSDPGESGFGALRELGARGRELERGPEPYPRPAGPAVSLEALRSRRGEIERLAARHGARSVRVFGSVACAEQRPDSDLDVLVEMDAGRGLLERIEREALEL